MVEHKRIFLVLIVIIAGLIGIPHLLVNISSDAPASTETSSLPDSYPPTGILHCSKIETTPPNNAIQFNNLSKPKREIFLKKKSDDYTKYEANSSEKRFFRGKYIIYNGSTYVCGLLHNP